ncbi:hypothetical protein YC2023_002440 [Brassica napus]
MISPTRRRHQLESLSVESSPLSLWSTNLRLHRSPRRFRLSLFIGLPLDLLNDSASLSISSTTLRIPRSPRRLTPPFSPACGYHPRNQTEIKS